MPANVHTTHALDIFNWVWDDATQDWVKMTQAAGGGSVTIHDIYVGTGTTTPGAIAHGATGTVLVGVSGADPVFSDVVSVASVAASTPITVSSGGTGKATATIHALSAGNGTGVATDIGVGATGTVLVGHTNADPSFSADPTLATVAVGTNPASTGAIRLANSGEVIARNAANSADLSVIKLDGGNLVSLAGGKLTIDATGVITQPSGRFAVTGAGAVDATSYNCTGEAEIGTAQSYRWAGTHARIFSSGNGLVEIKNNGLTAGVGLDVATDNTLKIRTRDQTGDGQLTAASVRGNAVVFASVPATPVEGMLVAVSDSLTAVWGTTITGGGTNHVLAYYNGTNWTVAGK